MPGGNPFVGLRPFRTEEALLFFGRRQQTTELVDRLHQSRFVAVVGSSGSGKSSIVFAGLIPRLEAGFLVDTRDRWRIVKTTPGEAPLSRLAAGFSITADDLRESGAQAIVDHLKSQPAPADRNCLILIDQFEELFRFALSSGNRDDAADFVGVLLALIEQRAYPVFVVITMRSDFLGDCDIFHGLPEALNRSHYLVPRLTRQQLRESVEGPVKLFGAAITPRLVDRILNEVGDDPDQLPVLQHALLRTWEHSTQKGANEPIDIPQYLEVGGVKDCLSMDAESALVGMTAAERSITEQLFQALTDTDHSNRRVRRPAPLSVLERITGATRVQLEALIEPFREGGRSFLIAQPRGDSGDLLVDISHEALIRKWTTLRAWVDAEAASKRVYLDLVDAVTRKKARLHDSDLQSALEWRERSKPSAAWAERYSPHFEEAMKFLDASRQEQLQEEEERRANRRRMQRTRILTGVIAASSVLLLLMGGIAWSAYRSSEAAREERDQAQKARQIADKERARAELVIANIRKSSEIRSAALSNDQDQVTALLGSLQDSGIRFQASADDLHYKNPSGQEVYKFEVFPDPRTIPKGNGGVAFITYFADHPTFRNTLMTAGADRAYHASYIGWGCLRSVRALIEYKDPMKTATVSDFDMCQAAGWDAPRY